MQNDLSAPSATIPNQGEPATEKGYDLLLLAASTLHANGESTTGTLHTVEQLEPLLPAPAKLVLTWGELLLQVSGERLRIAVATPSGINMRRVIATRAAIGQLRVASPTAQAALATAAQTSASGTGLFVLACAGGAGALSVINGAWHPIAICLIAVSAGLGAVLRRGAAARLGAGPFAQALLAALLAGFIGSLAVHWELSTARRLVALGPLLVLVPGPTLLNGALDLAALRLPLGLARFAFGLLTILAISTGVLMGLGLGGTVLPPAAPNYPVPLWLDVVCAGVAAAAYGVFYSMPLRLLMYPILVGMLAHATHWYVMASLGFNNAVGAGLACLVAGLIMVPVTRQHHLPFAGVGFATVVSMVPGIFLFRMGGGLVQIQQLAGATPLALLGEVLADSIMALETIVAMTLGLLLPMTAYTYFRKKSVRPA